MNYTMHATLTARLKPCQDLPPRRAGKPPRAPWCYRVLCGYPNCRGMLGVFDCFHDFGPGHHNTYSIGLAPGYVHSSDGTWRLGRHASKRRDHSPRRPRWSMRSSDERAYRRSDGELVPPGGRPLWQRIQAPELARALGVTPTPPACRSESISLGAVVIIECSRCHALSHFVVRPSAEILEEVKRRKHSA